MVRVGSLVSLGVCMRGDGIYRADKCFTWVSHTLHVQRSCLQPRLWVPVPVPPPQVPRGFVPSCSPQLAALPLFPGNEYKYFPSREKLAGAVWRPVTSGRSRHPTLTPP